MTDRLINNLVAQSNKPRTTMGTASTAIRGMSRVAYWNTLASLSYPIISLSQTPLHAFPILSAEFNEGGRFYTKGAVSLRKGWGTARTAFSRARKKTNLMRDGTLTLDEMALAVKPEARALFLQGVDPNSVEYQLRAKMFDSLYDSRVQTSALDEISEVRKNISKDKTRPSQVRDAFDKSAKNLDQATYTFPQLVEHMQRLATLLPSVELHIDKLLKERGMKGADPVSADVRKELEYSLEGRVTKTFDRAMFVFDPRNRSRFANSNDMTRLLMMFRQHPAEVARVIGDLYRDIESASARNMAGLSPEQQAERKEQADIAVRQAKGMLGAYTVMGGLGASAFSGLASVPLAMIQMLENIFGDDDDDELDPLSYDRQMYYTLKGWGGEAFAKTVMGGVFGAIGFESVSSRISLSPYMYGPNPFARSGEGAKEGLDQFIINSIGPAVSPFFNLATQMDNVSSGKYNMTQAVVSSVPFATLRNLVQAQVAMSEGAESRSGISYGDPVSFWAAAAKAMGFTPDSMTSGWKNNSDRMAIITAVNKNKQSITADWLRAWKSGSPMDTNELAVRVIAHNTWAVQYRDESLLIRDLNSMLKNKAEGQMTTRSDVSRFVDNL
jgi:hypothetical protein